MNFSTNTVKISELFNVACPDSCKTRVLADLNETDNSYVPDVDQNYLFNENLKDILNFLADPLGDSLYVFGPTGAGKSSLIAQVAARLNWPCIQVTGSGRMELYDLLGYISVRNKSTVYMDGPLVTAMKRGYIFVLNEMDLMNSGQLMGINDLLTNQMLVNQLNDCEIVKPHRLFRFIATGNSNGSGDSSGQYRGVQMQNAALMDRFRLLKESYMTEEQELNLLSRKFPTIPNEDLSIMVKVAVEVRRLFQLEDRSSALKCTMSTRTLHRWAHLYKTYGRADEPFGFALDRALTMRAEESDRIAIYRILDEIKFRFKKQ